MMLAPLVLHIGCANNLVFLICQEKAPYEAKAAKRKSEYEKQMSAYNKKQVLNKTSLLAFSNGSMWDTTLQ